MAIGDALKHNQLPLETGQKLRSCRSVPCLELYIFPTTNLNNQDSLHFLERIIDTRLVQVGCRRKIKRAAVR